MKIDGKHYRTIWATEDGRVEIIDQERLPHDFVIVEVASLDEMIVAIKDMKVRGAPLIGASAAYGMAITLSEDGSDENLAEASRKLYEARPTAVNLRWALEKVNETVKGLDPAERGAAAFALAAEICDDDVAACEQIGVHGCEIIAEIAEKKGATADSPVNVLTHCNAGWLATVDWGTALAPIYKAHDAGIPVHVWVDETRPRNQGAFLTAYELASHGVPHTVIVDNAGGHLMQHDMVDLCLVGSDRTTGTGDVCNKIGTYLKALAASDNGVPFYGCVPSSTVDWTISDGIAEIPIEQRSDEEVRVIPGVLENGDVSEIKLFSEASPTRNDAFDVTPARLVTGIITERGVADASRESLGGLFPEQANS